MEDTGEKVREDQEEREHPGHEDDPGRCHHRHGYGHGGRRHGHHGHHGHGFGGGRWQFGPFERGWRPNREEWLRRLEEHQKDLEQRVADVADLIRRLKEQPSDTTASV